MLSREKYYNVILQTTLTSIDLVLYHNGKILLGYRKNQPAKNFWFTPGNRTGKMETLQQGFERLVESELGLDNKIISFKNTKLVGVYDHIYNNNFEDDKFGTHYVVTCFLYKLDKKVIVSGDRQHSSLKWFDLNDIKRNAEIHPYVKNYIPNINKLLRLKHTKDGRRNSLLK
jgi:colanic acid biosynthesis protein WcaH